ncbi:MAG TPA: YihY/virulence factor BrkB family protein [Acidimicrobiales bacterium]|jgi:membrane protein|nr:YihY/virulence factor BrkB family protein [Acidimicrobiales bacterium]HWI02578.1 YihY/virulence factor BrkB family protein [Acidimicrobiales bacterium]
MSPETEPEPKHRRSWARRWGLGSAVDIARQIGRDSKEDRLTGLAAEVAFFSLLSAFPGLLAIAAGLGALDNLFRSELLARAQSEVITVLETFLTDQASGTSEAIEALFDGGSGGVFTFGVVAAVWAASRGIFAVHRALAQIYDVADTRSRVRARVVAVGLALASMLLMIVTLSALVVGPLFGVGRHVARWVGLDEVYGTIWQWAGVPVAFLALLVWAAVVYHSVPHRHVGWRQHVCGAALTGLLWLLVSAGLRLYLELFGGNPVFAILGGALVVLMWLYGLSLALLLGAELNAVLSRRAAPTEEESQLSQLGINVAWRQPEPTAGG